MIRLVTTLALAASSATAFAADDYVDSANGFKVSIPAGWQHRANAADGIDLLLVSPRFDKTEAMCLLLGDPAEDALSQPELNEGVTKFDEAFWRSIVEDKDTKDIQVQVTFAMRKDRKVSLATIRFTQTIEGKDIPTIEHYVLQLVPKSILLGQCGMPAAHEAEERTDAKAVLESFEPAGTGVISKLTPRRNDTKLLTSSGAASLIAHGVTSLRAERAKQRRR
jgi:hypothetical protein